MEDDNKKVFEASIERNSCTLNNDLYDIISREVLKPITLNSETQDSCNFQPTIGKVYATKKKSKLKVNTVRDIRNEYEKDIFETLPSELERQQKNLFRKIRGGYAKDENTKKMALSLLNSNKPISRSSWQMLMNINPKGHSHSSQFVLWNGKCIQVNGSRGGKNKFICNYDIYKGKEFLNPISLIKYEAPTPKRGLLRDSLNIRFKPGPLRKKKELDYSYQKYHVGGVKIVDLPKPGLEIQPLYGTPLEPTITTLLKNLQNEDGTISDKWAEFAVSMLGNVTNGKVQIGSNECITFNLNYKCNQKQIIMRNDFDRIPEMTALDSLSSCNNSLCVTTDESFLMSEVQNILDSMLGSVEISLKQDIMYSGADDPRDTFINESQNTGIHIKEKIKRKYCELDRLDVTVIRLSDKRQGNDSEPCRQLYCSLGCVCDSLKCAYNLKEHCGRIECMFACKCDFSNYKISDSLEGDCSEFLPGLVFLDKKINDSLSREEQKFHQTVIVTDEKSILLKSKRRNLKTSKKYADFYSSMRLRTENKLQPVLTVIDTKLQCDNIEPWCMVHSLYKCFCEGKFTQSITYDLPNSEMRMKYGLSCVDSNIKVPLVEEVVKMEIDAKNINSDKHGKTDKNKNDISDDLSALIKTELDIKTTNPDKYDKSDKNKYDSHNSSNFICARVLPYEGRKFSDGYYFRTNEKILHMEKNDEKLHAKMLNLMAQTNDNEQNAESKPNNIGKQSNVVDVANVPFELDELLNNILQEQEKLMEETISSESEELIAKTVEELKTKRLPNKTKLVEWLECTYKKYKERVENGNWKTLLSPPRMGKVALYPWDFILSRYQERKNLFFITVQKPFRIFMAVDARNPIFERCINIRLIPQSDILEYPVMVRNLICNAKDMKENFCILCGLTHCWELIGSVTKLNENVSNTPEENTAAEYSLNDKNLQNDLNDISSNISSDGESNCNHQESKWFIMTVEDDFSEIQFYKKGFFVKYESILKAIQVARKVGKTVRLSSQRCNDGSGIPQFGIYATPNNKEHSVFIGPYEKDESLGVETIKNSNEVLEKNKTRGIWININKVDNSKVIDNPLSFIPLKKDWHSIVTLDNDSDSDINKSKECLSSSETMDLSDESISPVKNSDKSLKTVKVVKPIKIRKTNGFYQLASNSLLKKFSFKKCALNNDLSENRDKPGSSSYLSNTVLRSSIPMKFPQCGNSELQNKTFNKPVAEIAPQIKITDIAALCNTTSSTQSKPGKNQSQGGMFILKPEEINERLANNFFHVLQPLENNNVKADADLSSEASTLDLEKFLDSSVECSAPVSEVYLISDDEDIAIASVWRNVWISCKNIKGLGWIAGRQNNENKLSFEFPGFTYTDFYDQKEAFNKINQVFSRKVCVPKNITMQWQVIESEKDLGSEHKLESEDLHSDFVLTRHGLINKNNLLFDGEMSFTDDTEVALPSPAAASAPPSPTVRNLEDDITSKQEVEMLDLCDSN